MEKIFISHSSKDESIASELNYLLKKFIVDSNIGYKYTTFYAPDDLRSRPGSSKWKNDIRDNMEKSSYCLALFTQNSIENRWVNYELGLASASQNMKKIIPLCVKGINFNLVIVNELQIINLSELNNYYLIMKSIFEDEIHLIDKWIIDNSDIRKRIMMKSTDRCAYFVGSKPSNIPDESLWDENVHYFIENISKKLLYSDFKLASFPSVDHIGKLVARCALEEGENKYEIAGLYEFDRKTEELQKEVSDNAWDKTIDKFRRIYLEGKDCMIIIGGGDNTKKEYEVAKTIKKIQIFPIPCFGGFGESLYEKLMEKESYIKFKHPCHQCKSMCKNIKCPYVDLIVKRLAIYEFENV